MKISASIYSNKNVELSQLVRKLDAFNIDYLHVDCSDDESVFDDIAYIRSFSRTPIDLHIISPRPEGYFDLIKKNHVEIVAFQHENLKENLKLSSDLSARTGIAFTNETPVEAFDQYKSQCSFVLFMTTTPGKSGGTFDRSTFDRIRTFKRLYPQKHVHVDGGVNDEVSFILRNLGVVCAISGSYLVKSGDIPNALLSLKSDLDIIDYKVSDFMIHPNELPLVNLNESNQLESLLEAVEHSKMGFTLIVDDKRRLIGVVTDGDIRRAVFTNLQNLENLHKTDLINRNPITIAEESSVSEMLKQISNRQRPILFIPVVNKKGQLAGAISFNNLVKGEL